jgi:hypothetical protein
VRWWEEQGAKEKIETDGDRRILKGGQQKGVAPGRQQPGAGGPMWRGAALGRGGEGGPLTRGLAAQHRRRGSNDFETDLKFKLIHLNSNPLQF